MTAYGASEKKRIDAVFDLVKRLPVDEELLSHWARYLCILTSGMVEVSLKSILLEFAKSHSHHNVINFVESRLDGITNLNEEKVYQLLVAFDPSWGELFRKKRTDAQKAALDSLLSNRHRIAHGASVGLTMARMKDYYKEIAKLLQLIEKDCVR